MTVVLWCFAGIGFLASLVVLAGSGVALWEYVGQRRSETNARRWNEVGREYMRRRLTNDAWWFSEDGPTMDAIRSLGEGSDVSSVREDWRRARKAQRNEVHQ